MNLETNRNYIPPSVENCSQKADVNDMRLPLSKKYLFLTGNKKEQ